MKYRTYAGATPSADTVISPSDEVRPHQCVTPRPEGGCDLWYREVDVAFLPGGNMFRRRVSAAGIISARVLIARPERTLGLSNLSPIRNGRRDALVVFTERTAGGDVEDGTLRCHVEGEDGPIWKERCRRTTG